MNELSQLNVASKALWYAPVASFRVTRFPFEGSRPGLCPLRKKPSPE